MEKNDFSNSTSRNIILDNNMICYKDFRGISSFNAKVDFQNIDTEDYLKLLDKSKKNYFFEWTDYNSKVKPFYDIDGGFTTKEEFDEVVEEVKEEVITKLSVKFPNGNFAISSSHGWKNKEYTENKVKKRKKVYALSFHFIVNNYECSIFELRQFNEENKMYNWLPHCDKGVYRNGGNMRALYSNKPHDERIKVPDNWKNDVTKHIIQSNEKTNEYSYKLELKKKITDFKPISPPVSSPSEDDVVEDQEVSEITKKDIKKFTLQDFEKVKLAILKLDKKRAIDYTSWLEVGIALYNNGDNLNNKTLKVWEEFSKHCNEKYDEMACYNKWNTFSPRENGLTIATIFHWLKEDNPQEHKVITKESSNKYEGWYLQSIDCLVENMNKELMHTKKNEYIQLDKNSHFMYCKKDIIDEYAKYTFYIEDEKGNKKKINPFNIWLENINRRDIIGLKFDPSSEEDPNYYNLFKGFKYEVTNDEDYTDIEPYLFHLKDVWANGDEETYEYILNWFAHIYQKPSERTDVAIVIPSETEGNGKNIVLKVHSKILGNMYHSTADINSIVGNFNPQAEGRLLLNLNECTWAGRKSQTGLLKALITEDTMTINQKNVKSYVIENYNNVIIFSNDENPIEIGKNNRRYYVLEIKEEKLEESKVKAILNVNPQKIFNYFMKRDISKFNATKFKRTQKETNIKEFSLGSEFDFWQEVLENNFISSLQNDYSFEILKDQGYKILKSHLYNSYSIKSYGFKAKLNNVHFFRISKKIFPDVKMLNANKNSKPRIVLYDIDKMKEDFNKFYNSKYF